MEITEVFYPKNRQEWRDWLSNNRSPKKEIWVQTYRKATGMPSITYDELVEESLCFGWIDGSVKKYDEMSAVQRVTPRRKKTFLSELNRQRIWKLQNLGIMTDDGILPIKDQLGNPSDEFAIPDWVREKLQEDPQVWDTFQSFPHFYRRLKIGWICEIQTASLHHEAVKRLAHLIKQTKAGKQYGTQPLEGIDI